jgi:TonB dependent receptor
MDFIQEVQVKSSGFEAQYGGALGGVVNVIQKRGSNDWHGSIFTYYNSDRFNANPNPNQIRNPQYAANYNGNIRLDQPLEYYYPVKDHRRIADPGFTLGGPLVKDRLWVFVSAAPDFDNLARTVNFTYPGALGARTFHDTINTYYSIGRLDFLATQKIRLYASWQYNYQRGTGTSLPGADDIHGQFNSSSTSNPDNFNGGIGYVAPNVLYNTGGDITITPNIVTTTRYSYWAYSGTNQSRGLPSGIRYLYADTNYPYATGNAPAPASTKALDGTPLPSQFVNSAGYATIGANSQTAYDWWRRYTFNQDVAFFKSGWGGVHSFKVGYGFMHGTNDSLAGVYSTAQIYVAYNVPYVPQSQIGQANCQAIVAANLKNYGVAGGNANGTACQGAWGTVNLRDLISSSGKVGGWNHSFYVQDAWTVGKYLTLNLGLRMDKENLPSYNPTSGFQGINFGWGQKLGPRLGAAYDLLHNGKVKVYGSFGYVFDIMKYNLPQGSFGGAYWHDCVYALDSPDYTGIIPRRDSQGHYCPLGGGNTPAVGSIPNARFIENYDYREPANDPNQTGSLGKTGLVDPNLKPMKQHVMTIGASWEITHNMVFEPIYTRTRLDRTIEDTGVITANGEVYYITNPGEGVNSRVPNCSACAPNPKAVRDYDGLELRLTRRFANRWYGAFSYTYSRLYGNYSGLTATDVSDGGGGRNGANTDRAFDEPFMSFDAHGGIINGPLPTDRPHAFKANVYYSPSWKALHPTIGLFQQVYSGTPLTSYMSVWGAPVFVEGRGKWVNMTRDSATGNWIPGSVTDARTPHFAQTDLSLFQDFHVSKSNEAMIARVGLDCINCFNQHHVTVINSNLLRTGGINPYTCGSAGVNCSGVTDSNAGFAYAQVLKGYDYVSLANSQRTTLSSLYGMPQSWQAPRTLRFQVKFTF